MNQFHEINDPLLQQIQPIQERIIQKFLRDKDHAYLYQLALDHPTGANIQALDDAFKRYYAEIRMIKYISNSLHFNAVNFDKKYRLYATRNQLFWKDDLQNSRKFMNMVSPSTDPLDNTEFHEFDLVELVEDEAVILGLKKLTPIQRKILNAKYALHLADVEIAQLFHMSQQAVSKARKKSLVIIREYIRSHRKEDQV